MTDTLTDGHLLNALDQIRNLKSERATLRDQFAMAALTGMLAANYSRDRVAESAYQVADYMLGARKEKK
jgi:hypothetical protein